MKNARFYLIGLLTVLLQVLVWAEFNFSPYLVLALLPAIVICFPNGISEIPSLILSFFIAFATDFFSDGILGLSIVSLLPVCFLKNGIIRIVFGSAIFIRTESPSIRNAGIWKFSLALLIANGIFLLIYILVDAAGGRSFQFLLLRFLISVFASTVGGLFIAKLFDPIHDKWN